MNYSLGFTTGALLYKESKEYIYSISSITKYLMKTENVSSSQLSTNSERSRKKIKSELDKRFSFLNTDYLELFIRSEESDQKIILLLAICKCYPIIVEFLLEVIYIKWKRFDYDVMTYDFEYFLSEKLSQENLDSISEKTKYKLSQVTIKMLKEIGMLEKGQIRQIFPSEEMINTLNRNGDAWFLNCLLITQ